MIVKNHHKYALFIQKLFGNNTRFNELDIRFITRDITTIKGVVRFPIIFIKRLVYELVFELWKHTLGKKARVIKPIFMYGVQHSGTTISMKLFADHPDVINYSEANTVFQPNGYFDYDNGFHCMDESFATEKERIRLHQRLEFRRILFNGNRIFNKNPNNTVRLAFLQTLFPDAYFIHIVRDGRAVVNSLIRSLPHKWETEERFKPWKERVAPYPGVKPPNWKEYLKDNPIEQHAIQWNEVVKYALEEEQRIGLNCIYIKYEDLCRNPRKEIKRAYEFCDLEVTDHILDELPDSLTNMNYKYQNNFTAKDNNLVVSLQKTLLEYFKYSIE